MCSDVAAASIEAEEENFVRTGKEWTSKLEETLTKEELEEEQRSVLTFNLLVSFLGDLGNQIQ